MESKFNGEKVFRKGKKNYTMEGQDVLSGQRFTNSAGTEKNQSRMVVALAVFLRKLMLEKFLHNQVHHLHQY
jgi:hypothetical protein